MLSSLRTTTFNNLQVICKLSTNNRTLGIFQKANNILLFDWVRKYKSEVYKYLFYEPKVYSALKIA